MAKRKRLGPMIAEDPAAPESVISPPRVATGLRPPIAQVAGESAAIAALQELSDVMTTAEDEGRLMKSLPLDQIDIDHLVRDRITVDDDDLEALKQSLRQRGQQSPIEVQALSPARDGGPRYGLISGWRRVLALRMLAEETGEDRFNTALSLIRRPERLADSYVAMVEENEIRADLSYFERARIVLKALENRVYESEKTALQSLFSSASYAKRSKIKSFIAIVAALDGVLRFPAAISERDGLILAKALTEHKDLAARLRRALKEAQPQTPDAEKDLLKRGAGGRTGTKGPVPDSDKASAGSLVTQSLSGGITVQSRPGRLEVSGDDINDAFIERFLRWMKEQV